MKSFNFWLEFTWRQKTDVTSKLTRRDEHREDRCQGNKYGRSVVIRCGSQTTSLVEVTPVNVLLKVWSVNERFILVTVRKRSFGKVMFSHLSVSHSVHGGGACVAGGKAVWQGAFMAEGGMRGRGACVAGVCVWQGVCVVGGVCGGRDSHCSGRYASYWNAF